jgi:hypothetical protein
MYVRVIRPRRARKRATSVRIAGIYARTVAIAVEIGGIYVAIAATSARTVTTARVRQPNSRS